MFTDVKNYNQLLKINKLNFEWLGGYPFNTLIDWEVLRFKNTNNIDGDSWVCVEDWIDDNNAIKIIEQNECDVQEITNLLNKDVLNHIYKLVEKHMYKLNKEYMKNEIL
ncbi:TPA: hypothetical protein ACJI4Q_000250 [Staphylococcus pseudintermedius]|uniref:hypothetical protein n=1 Tax=Staphylococcus pseudintermedius TaxID=283734 RepID=UPI0018F2F667|nr:hypothetical protein [Staphylococcus pseudintermedius]EGQ3259642.1 hypothetical protein [Staphylococcus pseudintermedius]EGQ4065597.1 hypothetical protein [Staphylococcus pseudintermedius]EJM2429170.1 hypothetical protein [Staphylococcus pseudintermedius]MBJ8311969.1 hypothetical protein [Staphylococcus pseudintermedius]